MFRKIMKYCIYIISFLSIRSDIIIVGSWFGMKFSDNSKYIYLALLNNKKYKVYWVTKSDDIYTKLKRKGYPVVKYFSIESIFIHLRAKYYFTSTGKVDVNHWLLGRARHIELWHGIPLKRIVFDDDVFVQKNRKLSRIKDALHHLFYTIIYPSQNYKAIYMSAFNASDKNLLCAGQPRNDVFFDENLEDSDLPPILQNKKYIVYLPTHRKEGNEPIEIEKIFNLDKLQKICKEKDVYFVIKKHFYHRNETADLKNYSNIIDLTTSNDIDTQILMKYSSALITDYSSCYIDYLLLDKPILMYAYDYEQYQSEDRKLYFPYAEIAPSNIFFVFHLFFDELENVVSHDFSILDKKQLKMKNFFYDQTNQKKSSAFILNKVLNLNDK